jgi:uncharacterized protein
MSERLVHAGIEIGRVVGNTSPQEFTFYLKRYGAKLGDLVSVVTTIPAEGTSSANQNVRTHEVFVWGRITSLNRYNPFLPSEAGLELADQDVGLLDTVLSNSRDQLEASVLVLGASRAGDFSNLTPLNYPVQPGSVIKLPPTGTVQTVLVGDDRGTPRINVGSLIGRSDVPIKLKVNSIVARHMAILAMTGGGKTVAARRIMRELMEMGYPLVIFDPHGDYLKFAQMPDVFPNNQVKLYFPSITVREENRDVVSYLVSEMTQGFTDPQRDLFDKSIENITLGPGDAIPIEHFISRILDELHGTEGATTGANRMTATARVVERNLRLVQAQMVNMSKTNERLRDRMKEFDLQFEPMPDPKNDPQGFVQPSRVSILYLGGYDHLTQSTVAALVLGTLYEHRASLTHEIPPFMNVVEEAHNFIPSHGEGGTTIPSVSVIRKVITEGRKFGVGLLLISQRPSRLDETTLSQCNSFLVLRLVNPRDQQFVEKVMENLSKADSRLLPSFGQGQGIVSGQAVRFPLLVQVHFDEDLVSSSIGDEDFVNVVKQWKEGPHAITAEMGNRLKGELRDAGV